MFIKLKVFDWQSRDDLVVQCSGKYVDRLMSICIFESIANLGNVSDEQK